MTFLNQLRIVLLSIGASLLASHAHGVAITDVNIQTAAGVFVNPSAAYLGQGKAKKSAINGLTGLFAGDPWKKLDKTTKPSKTFDGVDFQLTADTRNKSGDWGLAWGDSDLPQSMEFILVLKGGKKWGAYLFEAGSIFSDSGTIAGLFEMSLLNKRGKIAKLRNATIYGRVAAAQLPEDNGSTGPGDGSTGPGDGGTGPGDGGTGPGDGGTGPGDGGTGPGDGGTGPGDGGTGPGDGGTGPGDGGTGPGDGGTGPGDDGTGPGDGGSIGEGAGPNDPIEIPTPGSLGLLVLGLGLGLRRIASRTV